MKTPLLKRRLNPFLLATTVLVLSLLAGLSVIYQDQLNAVLSDNQELQDELNEKSQEISELEDTVSDREEQLSETESDLENFIEEADEQETRASELETELTRLETDQSNLESENENLTEENDLLHADLGSINNTLEHICADPDNSVNNGTEKCGAHGHSYEGN